MSLTHPLNLNKLRELISLSYKTLPHSYQSNQAVLILGDSGVGKSTFLSLISGAQLKVKRNKLNIVIESDEAHPLLRIEHFKSSEKILPVKVVNGDMDFFDFSGLEVIGHKQLQIVSSFFLKRLYSIYKSVKILLVIDQMYISQSRYKKLPQLLRLLKINFELLQKIENGVILVITKSKPKTKIEDYTCELETVINSKNGSSSIFEEDEKAFLMKLIENKRVTLFEQANQSQIGKTVSSEFVRNFLTVIKNTNFIQKPSVKLNLSEQDIFLLVQFQRQLIQLCDEKINNSINTMITQLKKIHQYAISSDQQYQLILYLELVLLADLSLKSQGKWVSSIKHLSFLQEQAFKEEINLINFVRQVLNKSEDYLQFSKQKIINYLTLLLDQLKKVLLQKKKEQNEVYKLKARIKELEILLVTQLQVKKEKQGQILLQEKTIQQNTNSDHIAQMKQKMTLKFSQYAQKLRQIYSKPIESKDNQELTLIILDIQNYYTKLKDVKQDLNCCISHIESMLIANKPEIQKDCLPECKLNIESIYHLSCQKIKKYPEIDCSHFRNGGQCIHCIKKWTIQQETQRLPQFQN